MGGTETLLNKTTLHLCIFWSKFNKIVSKFYKTKNYHEKSIYQ